MPFLTPIKVGMFFDLYPDAQACYASTNGKTYMNHHSEKAIADAKAANVQLFEYSNATTFEQIYPAYPDETEGFAHIGTGVDVVQKIEIAGEEVVLEAQTINALKKAAKEAANAAGLAVLAATGVVASGVFNNISIILNEDAAVVRLLDGDDVWVTLSA